MTPDPDTPQAEQPDDVEAGSPGTTPVGARGGDGIVYSPIDPDEVVGEAGR